MPLLKVHISSLEISAVKPLLSKKLRNVMIDKLQLDEKSGQVLLYEAAPQLRSIHCSKSSNFVFIEILMHPGRTKEMKAVLMKGLADEVNKILKIDYNDINICIIEVPCDDWYKAGT